MTDTIITVRGEFSAWYPAERATVWAAISFDGPSREDVFARATEAAETLRSSITALHDAEKGPVTWWSSESVRVFSDRPWSQDGAQLPLVFHAAIGFRVKFSGFEALAGWVEQSSVLDGVSITSVDWALTDATRNAVTTEVRSRSVKDAVTKATVFAQSIGLGSVSAIALADPGMLGEQGPSSGGSPEQFRMMKSMSAADASGSLELKPEEIEVASVVDARFVAR
ncbi:SIMPL domain-containing protein [Glaciihabitans arcticus]|nr:SIMPL domain-containing protein [Glaciihabitans arcticus]